MSGEYGRRSPSPHPSPARGEGVDERPWKEVPDLQSQLEALLDQVWRSEAEWRLDDRLALHPGQP
jgi:hypothetical protein